MSFQTALAAILEIYWPKTNRRRADTGPFCPAFELWLLALFLCAGIPRGDWAISPKRPYGRAPPKGRLFVVPGGSPEVLRWLLSPTSTESRRPT